MGVLILFAITPRGVGNPVGFRHIRPEWPLEIGEEFVVDVLPEDPVLAEDGISLRSGTAERRLAEAREAKISEIRSEALKRLQMHSSALGSIEMLEFLRMLWPVLNNPAGQPTLVKIRDIYLYTRQRIADIRVADLATISSYNPSTDPGWP